MARSPLRLVPLLLLLGPALLAQHPSDDLAGDRKVGAAAISTKKLVPWLTALTSPEFGGRGTGQEGFRKAAEFVRDHFQTLGLEPAGDDGTYWQRMPWASATVDDAASYIAFQVGGKEVVRIPTARLSGSASSSANAKAAVSLLVPQRIEGEERPSFEIPGLDEADLQDRIVIVVLPKAEPGEQARSAAMTQFQIVRLVQGKGAAAILTASHGAVTGGIMGRSGAGRGAGRAAAGARLAPLSLSFGGADLEAVLGAAGLTEEAIREAGIRNLQPLQAQVEVVVREEQAPAFNVVGILRGSDPKLKDEFVVIGSHLDHLGQRGNAFYPGADDDGSGTVGVLAVAEAFAKNPTRPARSILFVTFCGEENGLLGSRFFVENSPIPLSAIAAELQMDMIGRDEENARSGEQAEDNRNTLHLVGTQKISRDLHELCMKKNEVAGFEMEWDEENVFSRSDHASFAAKGIPIAFFFTGFHRDYHQQSDTVDKINFDKLARVATYVYDIGFELAQQSERPLVDPELWEKNRRSVRGVETPAAPVRQKD